MASITHFHHAAESLIRERCPQLARPSQTRLVFWLVGILLAGTIVSRRIASTHAQRHPTGPDPSSHERRLRRILTDARLTWAATYARAVRRILARTRWTRWTIIIDESSHTDRLRVLTAALWYRGRAMPLAWLCWAGTGPHAQASWTDCATLLARVAAVVPAGVRVTVVGDRAFGCPGFTDLVAAHGAVIWPFRGINQPIGAALQDGRITLRDLAWAAEQLRGEVQRAARTILFTQVAGQEPLKPTTLMPVISSGRYAEGQELRSMLAAVMLGFTTLLLSGILLLHGIVGLIGVPNGLLWWWRGDPVVEWAAISLIMIVMWLCVRQQDRLRHLAHSYRYGRWGEEGIVDQLRMLLDDRWTLFRNVTWPDARGGDIDMVLVGPGGVWAFEVKTYRGTVRNTGERWERRGRRRWAPLFTNPGRQARASAARLKARFDVQQIATGFVQPVVIWADLGDREVTGTLLVEQPHTSVWRAAELAEQIERIAQEPAALAPETVQRAVAFLTETAETARRRAANQRQRARTEVSGAKQG